MRSWYLGEAYKLNMANWDLYVRIKEKGGALVSLFTLHHMDIRTIWRHKYHLHLWRTYEEHSCSHFDVYPDIANFTFAIVFHPKVKNLVNTLRQIATWYLVRWKCLHFRKVQRGSSRLEFRVHLVAILPGSAPSCSRQVSWFSWIKWWL